MPLKHSPAERMRGLRSFVEANLGLLRSRPGTSLLDKLHPKVPAERLWYDFVRRTTEKIDQTNWAGNPGADAHAGIATLNKLVCSTEGDIAGEVVETPAADANPAAQASAASSLQGDAMQTAQSDDNMMAPQASTASSSVSTHASVPAEVVETRSAGTGVAAADVSMPEDEFHSAAEENDLPEKDVEMTHGAAEDDVPPEEEFHSAAGSSRDDVSMPEEEFHSAAGSSRDDAGVQGSGGRLVHSFSQWWRMRRASEGTEGSITYLQLEERLVHELVERLELEVPDDSWKRVPAYVKLFVLVGVCRHQGKLDAREEAFLSDVAGYCFEEVDRVTVDLFSYVFSLTSDDGSAYDDSSWPELIREMPNHILNGFLGLAAPFLCADSFEDFQAIGRYCRNSFRSIWRRGKNADSAHICSPDAAVETPGTTPSHQPQTSQDAETTRPQQDEVHASDEHADSAESSSPAEVAETPSALDSGSKRPRRE